MYSIIASNLYFLLLQLTTAKRFAKSSKSPIPLLYISQNFHKFGKIAKFRCRSHCITVTFLLMLIQLFFSSDTIFFLYSRD